jgi:hypothetical protein
LQVRATGYPLAYQWAPFPDESWSLVRGYRSYGIRWLPLGIAVALLINLFATHVIKLLIGRRSNVAMDKNPA